MITKNNRCLLTVATYSYLPKAVVLIESFIINNPGCDVLLLVPDVSHDKIKSVEWPIPPFVKMIGIDDIENPLLQKMKQYFDAFELCCAAKSFLLEHGLFKEGYEKAILLDPDIVCYASFDQVWSVLDHADVALTPHTCSPMPDDGLLPDDCEFVNSGFINGGFCAVKRTENSKKCLNWIIEKVFNYGFFIPQINLYADQTWMSCLPWFFPNNTLILRNSGMNVAYWNLHERELTAEKGAIFSNDERLVFFHFSGYDEKNPGQITKHSLRKFSENNNIILQNLVDDYRKKLENIIQNMPQLIPDMPCNNLPIHTRIVIYEIVRGEKIKFIANMQQKSNFGRHDSIFRKVREMLRKRNKG
ncbi:MAG TPA: glycosyltransferase [Candidatus Wunengus sp. YC60]|uniref:glycosyltransferase n=1 Tax=Candidatus Wunengus sp. YC60 TaxID=3367697 RepID=UPI004029CDB8